MIETAAVGGIILVVMEIVKRLVGPLDSLSVNMQARVKVLQLLVVVGIATAIQWSRGEAPDVVEAYINIMIFSAGEYALLRGATGIRNVIPRNPADLI